MNVIDRLLIVDGDGHRFLIRWQPDGGEWQVYGFAADYRNAVRVVQEAARLLPQPCTIECYGFVMHGRVRDGKARVETCYGPVEETVGKVTPS